MRVVYLILMLLMLAFAAVQFNDPDGWMWALIYAVPAAWSAIAAFRRSLLASRLIHWLLLACIFLSVTGVLWFWPKTPGWWRQEVWWEVETAREGMGMMIITVVLFAVWFGRPKGTLGKL
jgi:hypothetical protein